MREQVMHGQWEYEHCSRTCPQETRVLYVHTLQESRMLAMTQKQLESQGAHAYWQEKLDFYEYTKCSFAADDYPSSDVASSAASLLRSL